MQEQINHGDQTGVSTPSGQKTAKLSGRRLSLKTAVSATALGALVIGLVCVPVLGFAAEQTHSAKTPAVAESTQAATSAATPSTAQEAAASAATPSATPADSASPAAGSTATPDAASQTFVTIGEYDIQTEKRTEAIPFRTYMRMSKDVAPGHVKQATTGENGILEKQFKVYYKKGNAEKFELLSQKVVKDPVDQITYCGIRVRDARALPSRSGSYDRVRTIDMVATGYAPWQGSSRGLCATGAKAGYGVVAVDPRVIPMHTKLYIEGYGYAIAEDTGGAIKRNRIDLGHNTYREAADVGRRKVRVYVLSDR
ncbi:MAG TPA: 3D domain-containing protein [Capsulimonadaceae bacterium]